MYCKWKIALWMQLILSVMVIIVMNGCASIDNPTEIPKRVSEVDVFSEANSSTDKARNMEEERVDLNKVISDLPGNKGIQIPGSVTVLNPLNRVGEKVKTRSVPFYNSLIPENDPKEPFKLDLSNGATIPETVQIFSQILNFQYVIDPTITGIVSVTMDTQMNKQQLWVLLDRLLWLNGSFMSLENGVVWIRPIAKGGSELQLEFNHTAEGSISARLFPFRSISVKGISAAISPFLSAGGAVIEIEDQNALLVIDSISNMSKLAEVVVSVDQFESAGWQRAIFRIGNGSPSRVKHELEQVLTVLGIPVEPVNSGNTQTRTNTTVNYGAVRLTAIERLQMIVVSSATAELLQEVGNWIQALDSADQSGQEQVYIYQVENGRADELIVALSTIFNVESKILAASTTNLSSDSGGSGGREETNSDAESRTTEESRTNQSTDAEAANVAGPTNVFEVPSKVFADSGHNRLMIRATPRVYAMMKSVLTRLDTVAPQVLLQVLVSEITLTDDTEFGLEFSYSGGNKNMGSLSGMNWDSLNAGTTTTPTTDTGGRIQIFNPRNPDEKFGYIRALAGKGKLEVVSAPQVLIASHKTARVKVGEDIPIVTAEITDTASTTATGSNIQRSVQYRETGILLEITPQVTRGGMIQLDFVQEVSDPTVNTTSGIDSPAVQVRKVETTMALRDGATLFVGGLIRETFTDSHRSLPGVRDIPWLGRLFGDSSIEKRKTEMVVLVTARIIDEKSRVEEIKERYSKALDLLKRTIGEHKLDAEKIRDAEKEAKKRVEELNSASSPKDNIQK